MAETYHIYDYRQLPPTKVAVLVLGLKSDSRVKLILNGTKAGPDTLLLAAIADALNLILWSMTKKGQKNIDRPGSIFVKLAGLDEATKVQAFRTGEDFMSARNLMINKLKKGGD